jgi:hypothetical protein
VATLLFASCSRYCVYEIVGAESLDPDVYVKRVPARRVMRTQNDRVFESFPQFFGPFGF